MTSLYRGLALENGGVISLVGAGGKTSLMFKLAHELSASGATVLTTTTTKIFYPTADQAENPIISPSPSEILNRAITLLRHTNHITAASRHETEDGKLIGFAPGTIAQFLKSNLFRWIIVEADGAAGRPLKAPAAHEPVIPACTNRVIGVLGLSALGKPLDNASVFRPGLVSKITGLTEGMPIVGKTLCDILCHRQGIFQGTPVGAIKIVFLNQADTPGKTQTGRSLVASMNRRKNMDIARVVIGQALVDPPIVEYHDLDPVFEQPRT